MLPSKYANAMSSAPIEKLMISSEALVSVPESNAAWKPLKSLPPPPLGGKKFCGTLKGSVTVPVPVWTTSEVPPEPPLLREGLQYVISPVDSTSVGAPSGEKQFDKQPNAAV